MIPKGLYNFVTVCKIDDFLCKFSSDAFVLDFVVSRSKRASSCSYASLMSICSEQDSGPTDQPASNLDYGILEQCTDQSPVNWAI